MGIDVHKNVSMVRYFLHTPIHVQFTIYYLFAEAHQAKASSNLLAEAHQTVNQKKYRIN